MKANKLLIVAGVLFVVSTALLIIGVSASAPIALIPAMFCTSPLMLIVFGAALGRWSVDYQIVPKEQIIQKQQRGRHEALG